MRRIALPQLRGQAAFKTKGGKHLDQLISVSPPVSRKKKQAGFNGYSFRQRMPSDKAPGIPGHHQTFNKPPDYPFQGSRPLL